MNQYVKRTQRDYPLSFKLTVVQQVEKGEMPLSSYTFIHREARLSRENKKAVVDYLNALQDSLQ